MGTMPQTDDSGNRTIMIHDLFFCAGLFWGLGLMGRRVRHLLARRRPPLFHRRRHGPERGGVDQRRDDGQLTGWSLVYDQQPLTAAFYDTEDWARPYRLSVGDKPWLEK